MEGWPDRSARANKSQARSLVWFPDHSAFTMFVEKKRVLQMLNCMECGVFYILNQGAVYVGKQMPPAFSCL